MKALQLQKVILKEAITELEAAIEEKAAAYNNSMNIIIKVRCRRLKNADCCIWRVGTVV